MNSASWSPFPLSWKQRLAVVAWMLFLLSMILNVWKGYNGYQLHFAFFGPRGIPSIDLFSGFLITMGFCIPTLALPLSCCHTFSLLRILDKHQETVVHLSIVLSFAPVLLVIFHYPGHQPGFYVWWASLILASISLGMSDPPKVQSRFQFRLSTLLLVSILIPLCVYANLRFLSPGSSHSALFVRVAASVLALVLVFDLWKLCGSLFARQSGAAEKA
ncbi:MAG: hypothetical protein L6R28_20495 [Planctomycetes bacterium]|nr:hypothetical protein [Planctomycetota bacterium]